MKGNRLFFIVVCGFFCFLFSFGADTDNPFNKEKFVVVLDAGHGGHDPGNMGNGYLEKNIALKVVLEVGAILEKQNGIEVVYTRHNDTFIGLEERGAIANNANADLFVSVHCNAHKSNAYGAETYVLSLSGNSKNMEVAKNENSSIYLEDNYEEKYSDYDLNSPEFVIGSIILQEEFLDQSIALAKLVQENFIKKLKRKDRKVKQAAFVVLHQTFMPSVLVELGFLTNKNEGSYLNSKRGQREMGTAIANAVLSYKDGVDANLVELETPVEPIDGNPREEVAHSGNKTETKAKPLDNKGQTPPSVKKNGETKATASNLPKDAPQITFKVQILASTKTIPLQPKNFKGLDQLSKEPYKNMFRYLHGHTTSYTEAEKLRQRAIKSGYSTAYVVAYKNGKRTTIKEARKSIKQ